MREEEGEWEKGLLVVGGRAVVWLCFVAGGGGWEGGWMHVGKILGVYVCVCVGRWVVG